MRPLSCLCLVLALLAPAAAPAQNLPQAEDPYYRDAAAMLAAKLAAQPNIRTAKNVILFIGDGMGISTITAARIYGGQKAGRDGVSNKLNMETLPYGALSRTYSHDSQVTDSAPSATAMTTGIKTINDVLGVSATVKMGDCASARSSEVRTIFELAERAGLATGIVTTTRVTHATPAAAYAHSADRDWETDATMPAVAKAGGCLDIAQQLVRWPYGDGFEIIFGAGRDRLTPITLADPEYPNARGLRTDGRNLIEEWQRRYNDSAYVWNKAGFDALNLRPGRHVLGLFDRGDMQYEADRAKDPGGEPSLAEMTAKAIAGLSQDTDGFILMVEGARIDHAHHAGNAARALEDALAFDSAVATARALTSAEDTLIVVTADHSHVLTISGYPSRNNPILGKVDDVGGKMVLAGDGKPFTTLGYANGPGAARNDMPRENISLLDTAALDFKQQALVPFGGETHGGEDVAIFSGGPWAHLFSGVVDQQFIYHVIAHATGIPARAAAR